MRHLHTSFDAFCAGRFRRLTPKQKAGFISIISAIWILFLIPHLALAEGFHTAISGYGKTLNLFTRTSGFVPEVVAVPTLRAEEKENVFGSLARLRLKAKISYEIDENRQIKLNLDYDQQSHFGTFVSTGDFRIAKKQSEDRQFLDLSQTLVEHRNVFYEHRFYRASLGYEDEHVDFEVGRQQIPWGVGHFFTPTDIFNPFNPTQIELDERDGVDAANLIVKNIHGYRTQLIYTPSGKELHPQRYMARISRDIADYETGLLGGRVGRDHAVGFDTSGNFRDLVLRGEFLYREAELEKDFIKFTVNADYNFPKNIYALLEYHYNGQGRNRPEAYQLDRLIKGEIQQLSKNYLGMSLGHDLTSLIRLENRTLYNLNDQSVFERPEVQYEIRENMLLTAGAQLFFGESEDEYGRPKNLFLLEGKYSF